MPRPVEVGATTNQKEIAMSPVITVLPSTRMVDVAALLQQRGGVLQHRKGVSVIAPALLPGYTKLDEKKAA